MDTIQRKSTLPSKILWSLVAIIGAISFGILAVSRGEHVNAVWMVLAAICVYSIAYRFYSLFLNHYARSKYSPVRVSTRTLSSC